MKKLLVSLFLLLIAVGVFAQRRSEQDALQIAKEFFAPKQATNKARLMAVPRQQVNTAMSRRRVKVQSSDEAGYYIVNDEANQRFVIVSADERMYQVLGYSDNGTFNAENAPVQLFDVLGWYDGQYEQLKKENVTIAEAPKRADVEPILPLIKTKWGQGNPFNLDCPLDNKGETSVTGCVATAMAQVMNFYHYPTKAKGGSLSYKTKTTGTLQSINFNEITFNWDALLSEYDSESPNSSCSEVAKLMHACGVSVYMNYDSGSGANPGVIPYAMINYFGYNPNMQYLVKDFYKKNEWDSIIVNELTSGRPILYGGDGPVKTKLLGREEESEGAHEFVLDGMDRQGLFHFNFGWNGNCDGYFATDAINPVEDYSFGEVSLGSTEYDFNHNQGMVVGICPEKIGESQDIFYSLELDLNSNTKVDVTTTLKYQPYCCSNKTNDDNTFTGRFGLGVFDKDWNLVETLINVTDKDLFGGIRGLHGGAWKASSYLKSFSYDRSTFQDGKQYYIALYAQHSTSSKPTLVKTVNGNKDWYRATVLDGVVYLEALKIIKDKTEPPIPVPLPEGLTGTFTVKANSTSELWTVQVEKDETEEGKYFFFGIDPAVAAKGVTANDNKVVGVMNPDGNIRIGNQQINGNLWFNNFGSTDSVIVYISLEKNTMQIRNTWGTIDKSSGKGISQYSMTDFSYQRLDPVEVATPTIYIDYQHRVQITCATEGASIYYSFSQNGTEPDKAYSAPFTLEHNGIVKAVAKKDGKTSEVYTAEEKSFVVARPKIVADDNYNVTISCATDGAVVFYTTDGKIPTSKTGQPYEGAFSVKETTTIMAKATKEFWNDSETDTCFVVVIPSPELKISNKAGELANNISYKDKLTATGLTVSGHINGSDIKFIREMIINGRLAYLDLKDASIVAGGEPYYSTSYSSESTEDNVIGENMFYDCDGLISIKMPATATKICQWAFQSCNALTMVELPTACVTVEDYAFSGSKNLSSIHLPATITEFGSNNFSGCPKFVAFTVDESNTTYKADDGILYQNDTILVKYPMGKADDTFAIPATVKHIAPHAFSYAQVVNVTVPESVVSIGNFGFDECHRLSSISLPYSVKVIGNSAFWGCKSLTDVTMPNTLEKLPSYLFYNCTSLRRFTIGPSVTTIADNAFEGCIMLQSFEVDERNTTFASDGGILYTKDMKTLWRCPLALYAEELRLPESVEVINGHAFDKCVNIAKFFLGSNVKQIGSFAFDDCKMSAIYMPDGITKIGSGAFWGCDNLETFVVPNGVKVLESNTFKDSKKLNYVYLPQNVEKFNSSVFSGCKSLAYINSKIKDIESVSVDFSTYDNTYTSFNNIADTCTWRVPAGPDSDVEKYAKKYKEQPWWVSTWRIAIGPQEETMTLTLADDMVTFYSIEDLDFTGVEGLEAYIASGFSTSTGDVVMLHVQEVPAYTALLLRGTKGKSYEVAMKGTDYVYTNLLRGVLSDTEISRGYVLNNCNFVAVNGTEKVNGGEAWLDIDNISASRLHMVFMEPTGITNVSVGDNEKAPWYTLQGIRLSNKPSKPGVYVHQGRKVVVK